MKQISAPQLAEWLADRSRTPPLLLDVREPWEHQTCRIDGSLLMPMGQVPARLSELDQAADIVVICHHGGRSMQIALFLGKQGYAKVHNLSGGVDSWSRDVDPSMPLY